MKKSCEFECLYKNHCVYMENLCLNLGKILESHSMGTNMVIIFAFSR